MSSSSLAPDIRAWLASAHTASLATLLEDPRARGTPFATVVPFALETLDGGAAPWRLVLFMSELAVHTKNLRADARCSVLVAEPHNSEGPWRGWRVTLVGRMRLLEGADVAGALATFRARHPTAAQELPHDFSPWTLDVDATRYIAGFGRMGWQ